jgi:hypothetical protein
MTGRLIIIKQFFGVGTDSSGTHRLAARGAGSPASFIAWLMPSVDQSPST